MKKINRKDIIDEVSERAHISKKDSENAIREFIEVIQEALLEGKEVNITNFGTFSPMVKKSREGIEKLSKIFCLEYWATDAELYQRLRRGSYRDAAFGGSSLRDANYVGQARSGGGTGREITLFLYDFANLEVFEEPAFIGF